VYLGYHQAASAIALERIQAQRGYFTVFGNDKRALDVQLETRDGLLARVDIGSDVAQFARDYLERVQGISRYQLFRDLDSLGAELTAKYVRLHQYVEKQKRQIRKGRRA